jgi:hypothetical protein
MKLPAVFKKKYIPPLLSFIFTFAIAGYAHEDGNHAPRILTSSDLVTNLGKER